MSLIKCYNCTFKEEIPEGETRIRCSYCRTILYTEEVSSVKIESISKASKLRNTGRWIEAEAQYNMLLKEHPNNYSLMWERLLNKYGVVYVEKNDGSNEYCITCRKNVESEILMDVLYITIMNLASKEDAEVYEEDAKYISDIQRKIKEKSNDTYDIFICYKETDRHKNRTIDSGIAETIDKILTSENYKVFYSRRIFGKNNSGTNYEAAIFNAISSAKIMLVLGLESDYFESTWVKSEWTRFLATMEEDSSKRLIPLYGDFSASNLPDEMYHLQGLDLLKEQKHNYSKLKMEIANILGKESGVFGNYEKAPLSDLVEEGLLLYADNKYEEAKECFERAANAGNASASYHLGSMYLHIDEMQDYNKSAKCFETAAKKDHVEAMYKVAFLYEIGLGIGKDKYKAEEWYRRAEMLGHKWIPDTNSI